MVVQQVKQLVQTVVTLMVREEVVQLFQQSHLLVVGQVEMVQQVQMVQADQVVEVDIVVVVRVVVILLLLLQHKDKMETHHNQEQVQHQVMQVVAVVELLRQVLLVQ